MISGIAAWVSYWHMAGVAARYGETDASPYLLPVSVDGLIVVASICLVELSGRIRDAETATGHRPQCAATGRVRWDGPGPARRSSSPRRRRRPRPITDELLDRARAVAAEHRRSTGRDITRDQLRAHLRVAERHRRRAAPPRPRRTPTHRPDQRGNGRSDDRRTHPMTIDTPTAHADSDAGRAPSPRPGSRRPGSPTR